MSPHETTLKSPHLLRETGDVVVTGSIVDQLKQTACSHGGDQCPGIFRESSKKVVTFRCLTSVHL